MGERKNMSKTDGIAAPVGARAPTYQRRRLQNLLLFFIHAVSIALYLIPLTSAPHRVSDADAVLDEAYILSRENGDVRGSSNLTDVFKNDYWGRPMNSPSSHKSWRPFTVLTFRWLKGGGILGWTELFVHRAINVIFHAATAELCSISAVRLFPDLDTVHLLALRCLTKLLFVLHPAHVEVVANAANRPHILAILSSSLMLDPDNNLILVIGAEAVGLLSSETAIFQLPAVLATMTVIRWKQSNLPINRSFRTFTRTMMTLLPRYFIIGLIGLIYLIGRKQYDTLSIPDGLIRPAENPFYALTGTTRALTYALLLAIHVGKVALIDPIGFSHEYGFECIRNVTGLGDVRLLAPVSICLIVVVGTLASAKRGWDPLMTWAVLVSWFLTLFPVSGMIKVGTSIADRIVMASTFAFAIFGGRFLSYFLIDFGQNTKKGRRSTANLGVMFLKLGLTGIFFAALYARVHYRSVEWMDSLTLLESSLRSCPRSAKSNLEISKIYSGLYPEHFDLGKAISLLEKAEEIDPKYCDVHQQFAHCYIQQGKYLEFEERLTNAVLCPFSMSASVPLWQRYWKQITSDARTGHLAERRMTKYEALIQEAIAAENERELREQAMESGRDEL